MRGVVMHPGHLLIVALVLVGVVLCALALAWAWRTSTPDEPESVLAEFVRRDRRDPEEARRWLREQVQPDDAAAGRGDDESNSSRSL
jgi:hypothetical protein